VRLGSKFKKIQSLTFVTILALPAGYALFPAVRVTARIMAEPVIPGFAELCAILSVVIAITPNAHPVRHAGRVTQVRQSFPFVAGQQDTGIRGLFDNGQQACRNMHH